MLKKDAHVQLETIAWTFDLPLAIFCCGTQKMNLLVVACMGIFNACIEFCVDYDKIR